jgi:hypothetical protein
MCHLYFFYVIVNDASMWLCRTHWSIIKANTHHICMYWTLMSKVIHDLYWHSSSRVEFHSLIYTKDDSIDGLLYVNSSLWCTNGTLVLWSGSGMCPPHMHTNEMRFVFFFLVIKLIINTVCVIFFNKIISFSETN